MISPKARWILGAAALLVIFAFAVVKIDIPEFNMVKVALTHVPHGSYLPVGATGKIDTAMIGYGGSPELCFTNAADLDEFRNDVRSLNVSDREKTARRGYLIADGTTVRATNRVGYDPELRVRDGPSIGRVCWASNVALFDDVKTAR